MTGVFVVVGVVSVTVATVGGRWCSKRRLDRRFAAVLEAIAGER